MRYSKWTSPYEDVIQRFKNELYEARTAIIRLMPEATQRLLRGYSSCASREDTYRWPDMVATVLAEQAEVLSPEKGSYFSDRAYCPLCGDGSTSPYESGFTVPEGLRRHLLGWGNTYQCDVMKAALRLAREHWEEKFSASEKAAKEHKRIRTAERKKSEPLFRVEHLSEPLLIDEALTYGATARTAEELAWAEERLAGIGFIVSCEGTVKSYVMDHGDFIVLADPRARGQIQFRIYKKPLPKKLRRGRAGSMNSFIILDSWKHGIRGKYESRFAQATRQ